MQPAISLDGFIATPDGDSESWVNPADEARYQAVVERCGCVIVGYTTFKQYEESFNDYQNVMIFVCTSKTDLKDTEKVKYLGGAAVDIIQTIERDYGFEELVACGGGEVNGMLADAGLINEIVISIQPKVLGEGIPLFGKHTPDLNLELLSVNQEIAGVIQNHYLVI